jgi:quinol monooxygenase YgiN
MGDTWTMGTWTAKPGREEEFVAAWSEFAEWSAGAHHPNRRAWLLRDAERPGVFVSVGPWPSVEAVDAWRADPGFRERIGRIRGLLDGFEPHTLAPAVEVLESGEVVAG